MRMLLSLTAVIVISSSYCMLGGAATSTKPWKPLWNESLVNLTNGVPGFATIAASKNFVALSADVEFQNTASSVNSLTGTLRWTTSLNQAFQSSPSFQLCETRGTASLVFAISAGPGASGITALNRSNGAIMWTFPLEIVFASSSTFICAQDARSTLVIAHPVMIYAIDPYDGSLMWTRFVNTSNRYSAQEMDPASCGSKGATCIVYDDTLGTWVIESLRGSTLYQFQPNAAVWFFNVAGGKVIFGNSAYGASAFLWNGTLAWQTSVSLADAVGNADVIVSTAGWPSYNVTAVSTQTGRTLWTWPNPCVLLNYSIVNGACQVQFSMVTRVPIAIGEQVYPLNTFQYGFAGFDALTGVVLWRVYNQSAQVSSASSDFVSFVSTAADQTHCNATVTVVKLATGDTRTVDSGCFVPNFVIATSKEILWTTDNLVAMPRF